MGCAGAYGNGDNAGEFKDRISPVLNVAVGKWFTPGLGLRLQYSGLQAKGFSYDKTAPYVTGNEMGDGYYKQKFDYMNLHGDIMFNLNALLAVTIRIAFTKLFLIWEPVLLILTPNLAYMHLQ